MALIDRDATKNHIKRRMCNDCAYDGAICNFCDIQDALDAIDDMATVDAAPVVHGEWIEKVGRAKCSVCADECWADSAMEYNYCPNCGAAMDMEDK